MDWCEPHEERVGRKIPAARNVNGTPMCDRCFRGYPIRSSEGEVRIEGSDKLEVVTSVGAEGFFQWAKRRGIAVEAFDEADTAVDVLEEA